MEIDNQINPLVSTTPVKSTAQSTDNTLNVPVQKTDHDSGTTVDLSEAGKSLASSPSSKATTNTEVSTSEQAQNSIDQFQRDAANDPSLTQSTQASSITSELVTSLVGS